ncbi:nitroreductase/quinone reductase family protein [Tsukamurella sp. 8F]|uniref:nitroreductase/quinone reductase family protein n=1 Tax=unclassified Tsukamurella TaxID=2633480 RepID=UPI0023B9EC7D|nr:MULTISPECIES: nitroreductase/quinone reductase family protein [unclassified Tsukamurella]MDF0530150.1 nitroreductase/quinone reductase family protein [Tsukamurella sp. 8J]MDF0586468.1 nitroreductase/quinone reductase family protein [Tsukamurella sp. 8F]
MTSQLGRWTTVRARANNLMMRRLGSFARAGTRLHSRYVDRLPGRLYSRIWLSAPVFRLTVRGRKSGEPRSVALMHVLRGDDIVVIGGNAGARETPNWFLNLRAAGEATAEIDGRARPVTFREVDDPEEVEECRQAFARVYPGMLVYEAHTERTFPVGLLSFA